MCIPKLSSISAALRKLIALGLLPHGEGGEEDRHQTVLAERNAELRMTGDLQNEVAVAALVQQLVFRQAPHRKTTEHEGT